MHTMRRRAVAVLTAMLLVGFLALLTAAPSSGGTETDPGRDTADAVTLDPLFGGQARPNIVVIMLDDMRDDELRFMPNAQRLIADQGVRFVNSFSPQPLCCPARASFITGEYTHNHHVWSHTDPWGFASFVDGQTLPVWLQEVGYNTAFLGKYLNGYGRQPLPDGTSSTYYVPPGWTDWRGSVDRTGLDLEHPLNGGTYRYFDTTLNVNGRLVPHQGRYQSHVFGEHSEQMIEAFAQSPQPFFLWASYVAPHSGSPDEPDDPERVLRRDGRRQGFLSPARPEYLHGGFDDVVTELPTSRGEPDAGDKPFFIRRAPQPNAEERRAMLEVARQRAEAIAAVDEQVGRTIDVLERTGELDSTIVVLTSDNGYFQGEHRMRQGKILPYEPSLRVPLVMRGPGIPAGEVREDPFLTIDFTPTALEAAGAPLPPAVDGVSMLDVARAGDRGWTRGILTETGPRRVRGDVEESDNWLVRGEGPSPLRFSQGVRTERYLYVEHASRERELYDVVTDPAQDENLVGRPGHRRTTVRLAKVLDRLRNCVGQEECARPLPAQLLVR